MNYGRLTPPAALAGLVQSIWVQQARHDPAARATRVLPAAGLELLVHFGDPFEHLEDGRWRQMPRIYVVGQRTRSLCVRASAGTGILIARFHVGAAPALLGCAAAELTDRSAPLDAYLPEPVCERLAQQICAAGSLARRLALLAAFLTGQLRTGLADQRSFAAARRINTGWGRIGVAPLAAGIGLSRRQLARRFRASVGIGPKRFARIVRFQKAVGLWRLGARWPEVVERCGYADQAHFIAEFRQHAGLRPSEVGGGAESPLQSSFNQPDVSQISNTLYL